MSTDQNDLPPIATLYVNRAVEFADLDSARAYLTKVGEGYYLCAGVELAYRVLPKYPGFEAAATAVVNPETIFTGGPDGPIREPGDDVPSASDVLTPDETAVAMRTQSAFVAKAGMYGVATDMRLAAEVIESQNMQIERMAKQVALLAAEKRQAQEWIANLRKSNELYSARISFLEGGK